MDRLREKWTDQERMDRLRENGQTKREWTERMDRLRENGQTKREWTDRDEWTDYRENGQELQRE